MLLLDQTQLNSETNSLLDPYLCTVTDWTLFRATFQLSYMFLPESGEKDEEYLSSIRNNFRYIELLPYLKFEK